MSNAYTMTISRMTVDKLGVKLYDRVSAVIAELVANSYDADAQNVNVVAPMDELLATKSGDVLADKGYTIEVQDDGSGMTPEQVNQFYLVVGAERRKDPRRGGETSAKFKRRVMGRKGVGKLAPFGICQKIEIISSGGKRIEQKKKGKTTKKGYLTAHLTLDRSEIVSDTDESYHPTPGPQDGSLAPRTGTTIKLTIFDHRRVPKIEDFERQLAQRFGLSTPNWKLQLLDSLKTSGSDGSQRTVGDFAVDTMSDTMVRFEEVSQQGTPKYQAVGPNNEPIDDMDAGFTYEGDFYPLTGWVAYSKQPYKDELMAGIRIYCRGKIAAKTHIFNMKAGFTGEYDIRSYLVGALHADWLDEKEDLIRTDRQDILWSHAVGQAFEAWGQDLVKHLGKITREPRKRKAWDRFREISDIEKRLHDAYPSAAQDDIRENALEIAKAIARTTTEEDLLDQEHVKSLVDLSLLLGPHITLDEKLRQVADESHTALTAITGILRTARVAELAGFGRIADDRVRVIRRLEELKDDSATLEDALQSLIENAPWLIDPQWAPITANQTFATLKSEFQKFYKEQTGEELILEPFAYPAKRADFVMSNQGNAIEIIEIKRPDYEFSNGDMERLNRYVDLMTGFLERPGNEEFRKAFPDFRVTLVCDRLKLTGVHRTAFDKLREERLTHITWTTFLLRTRKTHEDFLNEANRQRQNASK